MANTCGVSGEQIDRAFRSAAPLARLGVTGSLTCPMTASAIPQLLELHQEFGDRVDFALLSAREAHPGENYPQPMSDGEIHARARELRDFYGLPFAVLVDDSKGSLHQRLDNKPNAASMALLGRLARRGNRGR